MNYFMKVILLIAFCPCDSTMTSPMKSQKYVQMTNATGAHVCSTDPPSQVLLMFPGGKTRCAIKCSMSSACPYYQFKASTTSTPIQCELYNLFPRNFKEIDNCIGFRFSLPFDINECLTKNGGCGLNAICANTPGSFTCTCRVGFTGNGYNCTDINECLTNDGGCITNSTCNNTIGSFLCLCKPGYPADGVPCAAGCIHSNPVSLVGANGTIASMNFPQNYPNKADCQWVINASAPYSIVRLGFSTFCTEPGFDFVKVYDGRNAASPLLMSTSGCGILTSPLTTNQSSMFVRFSTDNTGVAVGFNATYNLMSASSDGNSKTSRA